MILSPQDQLKMMVSADQDPVLTDDEVHTLLSLCELRNVYSSWEANREYALGNKVVPSPRNGYVFVVTTAGTSSTAQPPFSDTESASDGSVVWELFGVENAYNLRKAAAQGWRIKAGKVANRFAMKTDVSSTSRDQIYKHCMAMYKSYRSPGTIMVANPYREGYVEPVITNVNAG